MVKSYAIKEVLNGKVEYYPGYRSKEQANDGLKWFSKKPGAEYSIVFVSEFIRRREKPDGIENRLETKEIPEELIAGNKKKD